jgi:hypothetical protein
VLRHFGLVANTGPIWHLLVMLDVMREREPTPERIFSPREFRAIADDFDLPWTPTNRLALVLAAGFGRLPVRLDDED